MNNAFDELTAALNQARNVRSAAKTHGNAMLDLLDGNLRGLSPWRLAKIKKQLRAFNIHTERWSE